MILSELIRPLLYIAGPLLVLVGLYFKGYSDGAESIRAQIRESEIQISKSVGRAERKNEEIRYDQEKERVDTSDDSLSRLICLFNSYFGAPGDCRTSKAHQAENQGLYEACLSERDFRELYLYIRSEDRFIDQLLNLLSTIQHSEK